MTTPLLSSQRLTRTKPLHMVVFGALLNWLMVTLSGATALGDDIAANAPARLSSDLQYLSADELEGRNVGTEGIARAGDYIAARFEELGLDTQLFDGTPFQNFTIPGPPALGEVAKNTLSVSGENLPDLPKFVLGENFSPLSLGSNGKFSADAVFVGYGITAPDFGYDDYAGVDVRGKVVIVLRKEPQQNLESSKFEGTRNSQFAYFSAKEINAAFHEAAALILVNDRFTAQSPEGDTLLEVGGAGSAMTDKQIPTYFCLRSAIDPLIERGTGKSLEELEQQIDDTFEPQSQLLSGLQFEGEAFIEQSKIPVRNVIGLLPGVGSLSDEYVIVGAHYDHVGMGGEGSLAPGTIAIHNGADDNASGTTTLMEVARRLAADTNENRRNIVFIAFTAEEKGLLGSKHYVRSPRFPLEKTVAMVNMDMVGRLTDNSLTVYGTGTAVGFDELIDRLNERGQFVLDKQAAGFGPSDHSSFYEVDIPVFHFFTGLHNQYHRPSDDFELINVDGMARIAEMVTGTVQQISIQAERPALLKTSAFADVGRRPSRRANRAVLGIQLDLNSEAVRIAVVTEASPAEQAGLKAGDVIVKLGAIDIDSTQTLLQTLSDHKPGDALPIVVERDNATVDLQVTLGGD